jgi:aminopeptidase N
VRIHTFALAALLCLVVVAQPHAQRTKPKLNRAETLKQLARGKAGALERRWEKESKEDPSVRAGLDSYDVHYYDIYWRPDYSDSSLYGEVGIHASSTVEPLNNVLVLLHSSLNVDSVYNSSGILLSSHQNDLLTVYLDKSYSLGEEFDFIVVYSGQPEQNWGIGEGLFYVKHNGVPMIENLSEPYGARRWWPCKDVPYDKADSLDIRVTCDTGMVATSNGILVSDTDHGDGTHTMHWSERYPITTYLVCLSVTNYVSWTDYYVYSPTDSMPVVNYIFPEYLDDEDIAYGVSPLAITVLADLFGEYPFIEEKYGHSMCVVHGMEHQCNTALNHYFSVDEPTVVHELAHHWFGNQVTCADWHHIWLNEGIGTYCEPLFYEVLYGTGFYHDYINQIEYWEGGSLYVTDVTDVYEIFSGRSYWKGAWVCHMLRHVVGDSAFFEGFQSYISDFAYANATTEDLQAEVEAASGMELDWFFQDWIYGEYYPIYRYSYMIEEDPSGGWNIYLHIRQKQTTDPLVFRMMIDIPINTASGEETMVAYNDRREQNFIIHVNDEPTAVYFDPDKWILRKMLWESYGFHIVNETLAPAVQAQSYEDTVKVRGGSGNHMCEVISGSMPDGWSLYPATGIISGATTVSGTFNFMIRATDQIYGSNEDSMAYTIEVEASPGHPGDANADGEFNVGDVVYVINYVFKQGPAPQFPNWADVNVDCEINVADAVFMINYIFKGGAEPQFGCAE